MISGDDCVQSRRGKLTRVAVGVVFFLFISAVSVYAAPSLNIGPHDNGTGTTPHGWTLTPAGTSVTLNTFPVGGAVSPDHRFLVVSTSGWGTQSLQVINIATQKIVQTIPYKSPQSLYFGLVFSPDGKMLYASAAGNNKIRVFQFNQGTLTEQPSIVMQDQNHSNFYPQGISISPDGSYLYTADNLNQSVSMIDLSTGKLVKTAAAGRYPYMTLLNRTGNRLYVSNWEDNSVTVLNAKDLSPVATVRVGMHPNALALNPANGNLYVVNSDSDRISVIDSNKLQVVQNISVAPYAHAPVGSIPDALTFSSDGRTMYVANAGNNDIAQIDLNPANNKGVVKGLIPTAWYPTGIFLSGDGKQLLTLSAKGLGAGPESPQQNIGDMMMGTLSFIAVPDQKMLVRYTKQVRENNQLSGPGRTGWLNGLLGKGAGQDGSPIPRFTGEKSPIKHVIYVIKENQTYDQIFGDIKKGNGNPDYAIFGNKITPNLHKLANQFVLLDNFYSDAEVSEQGHVWVSQAEANDFSEKSWIQHYSGRRNGGDWHFGEATRVSGGYIWDNALRSGLSIRNYGESVNYNARTGLSTTTVPGLNQYTDQHYTGWYFPVSDVTRVDEWAKEYTQYEKDGNLPRFETVYLPNDHTEGTSLGHPTPQAYLAQNDLALGKLVDTVSHSKDWKSTAIFVTEDDPGNGIDHVESHRQEGLVISPYTQTGKVDSFFYDQMSMYRTMEMILGLKPMTQYDASAIPMLNSFTSQPNFSAYDAAQPTYPLNAINGKNAPMGKASAGLNFSRPDIANENLLNRALWKATKGNQPYPSPAGK
jgi:Uncharacterized conserved protein